MKKLLTALAFILSGSPAMAGVSCSLPFNLTNGTTADASQVMANYNAIVSCLLNAAAAGINTDITALLGLTTPIKPPSGGTPVFLAGTTTEVGGNPNTQAATVTTPSSGYALTAGYIVVLQAGATNTGALTLNINSLGALNVYKFSTTGPVALAAGDFVAGQMALMIYDGTEYQLLTPSSYASLTGINQILSGGAVVNTSVNGNLGTPAGSSTLTVNCGLSPYQYLTNNAAFTLAAPTYDSGCDIMITNGASAGVITPSGFTTNSNTGEPLTTVSGNHFLLHIERINSISTYLIKALQ
jgi:hypothetical protein